MIKTISNAVSYFTGGTTKPLPPPERSIPMELHFISQACEPGHSLYLVNKRGISYECANVSNSNIHYVTTIYVNVKQPQLSFHLEDHYGHTLPRRISNSNNTVVFIPPNRSMAFSTGTGDGGSHLEFITFVSYVCTLQVRGLVALQALLFALRGTNGVIFDTCWLSDVW